MRHNSHACDVIETLYRNLRNNFIFENFSYSEMQHRPVEPSPVAYPSFQDSPSTVPQQSMTPSKNLSQRDNQLVSSNASLRSFTLGNNSSIYFSNPSNLNDSGNLKVYQKRKNRNAWEVLDEKCFFQPIKNGFYQKYVLRYTKFRPKLRQRKKRKRKVVDLTKSTTLYG